MVTIQKGMCKGPAISVALWEKWWNKFTFLRLLEHNIDISKRKQKPTYSKDIPGFIDGMLFDL